MSSETTQENRDEQKVLGARVNTRYHETAENFADENGITKSDAVRELLKRGKWTLQNEASPSELEDRIDELQEENQRLQRELETREDQAFKMWSSFTRPIQATVIGLIVIFFALAITIMLFFALMLNEAIGGPISPATFRIGLFLFGFLVVLGWLCAGGGLIYRITFFEYRQRNGGRS